MFNISFKSSVVNDVGRSIDIKRLKFVDLKTTSSSYMDPKELLQEAKPLDLFVKVNPKTKKPIKGSEFMVLYKAKISYTPEKTVLGVLSSHNFRFKSVMGNNSDKIFNPEIDNGCYKFLGTFDVVV